MEREPLPKTQQKVDLVLTFVSGGVIGIIGAVAESNILSQKNIDTDLSIIAGGSTLAGAALALNGAVRLITSRRASKKDRE